MPSRPGERAGPSAIVPAGRPGATEKAQRRDSDHAENCRHDRPLYASSPRSWCRTPYDSPCQRCGPLPLTGAAVAHSGQTSFPARVSARVNVGRPHSGQGSPTGGFRGSQALDHLPLGGLGPASQLLARRDRLLEESFRVLEGQDRLVASSVGGQSDSMSVSRMNLAIRWSVFWFRPMPTPKLISHFGERLRSITGTIWCCCAGKLSQRATRPSAL